MHTLLVFTNIIIFLCLSFLHVYWAMGGTWALDGAMPDAFKQDYFNSENKTKATGATIVVALGLSLFAGIIASNYFNFTAFIPAYWTMVLTRIIAAIFILRAIGDFNHFGLFKKKSNSIFALKDSQIYIPLCLYLGISCILITC